MRYAVLLAFLSACTAISTEDGDRLASHQRNAKYYFDGGRLPQAMDQIERGLEIAPDDYMLNSLKGAVLLRSSASAQSTDHKRLDEATEVLAKVYETRSANRHQPYLLLNYALALQKQGQRHLGEAIRLEGQATRTPNASELEDKAKAERQLANDNLIAARDMLGVLIERGEVLRIAHNHRFQIAEQLGDQKLIAESSKAYLEQVAADQAAAQREIERTVEAKWEAEQLATLRSLREEELEVRAILAKSEYDRQDYVSALTHLNRVLELDPQRSVDYYNRGRVLLDLKQTDAAKKDFERFLATTNLPSTSEKKTFAITALGW
ncbi:MAG TPA: tetratricopeptide repeat protein [Planctomycetota bacterium]|nr:tetratricopeptide repeat protein [Planctomycetota bacterium]